MIELSKFFAKFLNQNIFKYQLTFLISINKYGEDIEIISQTELPITLGITHKNNTI